MKIQDVIVRVTQWAMRRDFRGSTRLYEMLSPRVATFRRAPVFAFSGKPLLIDVSARSTWAFAKTKEELCAREPELVAVLREIVGPTSVVFDIGANIGLITDLLRSLVGADGAVEAFEPNPALLPALQDTFRNDRQVRVHGLALAEVEGELPFYIPTDESMASLGNWRTDDLNVRTVMVPVVRLDDLVESAPLRFPSFVKIDVEGAEARVFAGARRLLNRVDAPILWFEHLQGAAEAQGLLASSALDVLRSYTNADYSFWTTDEVDGIVQFATPPRRWCDVMALPASKSAVASQIASTLRANAAALA